MSKMKRIMSKKDLPGYTLMKQVLINLDLNNKDYCITFKDGNMLNTHWANLEKVTRAELNRRIGEKRARIIS